MSLLCKYISMAVRLMEGEHTIGGGISIGCSDQQNSVSEYLPHRRPHNLAFLVAPYPDLRHCQNMDVAFENTLAIDKTTAVCYVAESVILISRLVYIGIQIVVHYHVTKPASILFGIFKLTLNMNAPRPLLLILFNYLHGFGLDETVEFRLKRPERCWLASDL